MRAQPAMQGFAQPALPLAMDEADDAFASDEGRLQQAFRVPQRLVGAQPVQIGLRHFGARFGLEQQGVEFVERRERRHRALG